jgi:extradiol dioxygenase family protein
MEIPFHLSIGVNSFNDEIHFFTTLLNAEVTHRNPEYVNLEVFGAQITIKEIPGIKPNLPELHFGFNLTLKSFDDLATSIMKHNSNHVAAGPTVVDANTPMERKKMYLKSPSGYLVELKGYR